MDVLTPFLLIALLAPVFWVTYRLKARMDFLEHEVRWLRKELEDLKPTEVRSAYD